MSGLSVRGLTVVGARRAPGSPALKDLSFSAPAGAVTAVLGHAGAGKTTLLAAIAGLLPAARGAVLCGGSDITKLPARKRGVGFLQPGLMLPATRSLRSALCQEAGSGRAEFADRLLAQLGSGQAAARKVAGLSHGEAALALTAARLLPPGDVLLVDEAGAGLDEAGCQCLWTILRQFAAEGRTVLLATRTARIALGADHLVLLDAGQSIGTGTPASLYAEPRGAAAAQLTGDANIVAGHVRELRPHAMVWAAGSRHVQALAPDAARPVLGNPVALCLRPERLALLAAGEPADNILDGVVTGLRTGGPLLQVQVETKLGNLHAAAPSWRPHMYPATGQPVRLG